MTASGYRVIATDLDGTLLRSDRTISPRTLSALDRCLSDGTRLVIATGRSIRSVPTVLPTHLHGMPLVCYDGAEVHENGRCLARNHIDPEVCAEVLRVLLAWHPDVHASMEIDGTLYTNLPIPPPWAHEVVDLQTVLGRPVAKMMFSTDGISDIDGLTASLPAGCRCIITTGRSLGEITAPTVDKATALEVLLGMWGLGFEDMIAFGDEWNDIGMIQSAGCGVAMSNAIPELHIVADRVTASNDEDGVAQILESILAED